MINAFLLILATLSMSSQAVLKKAYSIKTDKKGTFLFSALSVSCACIFFLVISRVDLHFTVEILPYAFGFALSYGTAVITGFLAVKFGSLSLTSLVTAYSLIIPTFYGLLFLNEDVGILFYIGLFALCVSLFLMNSKRSDSKISLKWIIVVFLAFLGNGVCSTVQTVQQKNFAGQYKSEMMIIALLTVCTVMLIFSLIFERKDIMPTIKKGGIQAASCGIMNGVCNFLVMILAVKMDASIMFPVMSAGGIVVTGLVSVFIYKEKLSRGQYAALVLGITSVVLMNI